MNLINLIEYATNRRNFDTLSGYVRFCAEYLVFIQKNLQARIISQNENNYQFFQYNNWGSYQITRPINSNLFLSIDQFERYQIDFMDILKEARNLNQANSTNGDVINRSVYTIQQSIGAALDALPPGESNKARKVNGDLFEQFIRLIFREMGVKCNSGVVKVPVMEGDNSLFDMNYQHDLIVKEGEAIKLLGTIKTSSKDRLDKMFVDKFLYSRLTGTAIPHVAIILNDVQRKKTKRENEYGISATFLPGHFKGYTVKLNPLDGVYYCDIRPNMQSEPILMDHIKTFDHLILEDVWRLI